MHSSDAKENPCKKVFEPQIEVTDCLCSILIGYPVIIKTIGDYVQMGLIKHFNKSVTSNKM